MQTNTKMFMQRDNQSNRCSKQFCPIKIWKSVRVWIGWENNRPIKSVDAVVKEHRLFIVFLVLVKKSGRQKENIHIQYKHAISILRQFTFKTFSNLYTLAD